ncbi:MAG: elongation factor G [Acidobacteria bacterium]|nr:MAG: elongation factor G [Acidobacteriota bacterium]
MKVFDSENIRNIAVVGHGDSGKTSLVSAMLYSAGAVNRLGRVEEGNTVTDYDEDEIQRRITINTALARCEWNNTKINLLDTPGYRAFILDAKAATIGAEAALVLVDAVAGVEVQTEEVWSYAEEFKIPRVVVINKLDRERASFSRTLESLHAVFGRVVVPVALPIGDEKNFTGVVDLIRNRAFMYQPDGSGNFKESDIPAELKDQAEELRSQLIEMVAEGDDSLMEKFFEHGTLSDDELMSGLRTSLKNRAIAPAVCTSATLNIGVKQLMDSIVKLFPTPLEREPFVGLDTNSKEPRELPVKKEGKTLAFVFKTLADPFAGRISMIKVVSGTLKGDSTLRNLNQDKDERLGPIQIPQGKTNEPVPEARAGDICAVLKLRETTTGDTLGERGFSTLVKKVDFPEPAISFAILPKSRGDEDKIGSAIARIIEEDPSIRFGRDPQTKEFLLSGSGQLHVEVVVAKLQKKFGVEVILRPPKVPYRETILGKAEVQGKHKKQTGGHGQFGDCWIRMEPLERGKGFEFVNDIFGGSIPRQFVPAVEKGVIESAERGFLAGYPVVDFRVSVFDGSYHEVDSSEMAFKIAGSLAFKKAMEEAKPVLLEPIMNVEIYVPEENAGDIMGDLNSRRGRIQGMDRKGNNQVVKAQVPLAEMLSYAPVLTSLTGGRGNYRMEYSHYDVVPAHIAEKVIAEAKKEKEEQ